MAKLAEHYVDPRLVELYDIENPRGADADFYLRLAAEIDAYTIIDLGCGTGLITRELATPGRQISGVDPSTAMLAVARRHSGTERVRWVEGDARALGTAGADLVIMTGNVAQVFVDDAQWHATLAAIHAALRPGGYLSFESRNPADRAWERWNRAATYTLLDSPYGQVETWLELVQVGEQSVTLEGHNRFLATGEVVIARDELRYRSQEELATTLTGAGFSIEHIYGDWQKGPLLANSYVMIFVARRA